MKFYKSEKESDLLGFPVLLSKFGIRSLTSEKQIVKFYEISAILWHNNHYENLSMGLQISIK